MYTSDDKEIIIKIKELESKLLEIDDYSDELFKCDRDDFNKIIEFDIFSILMM